MSGVESDKKDKEVIELEQEVHMLRNELEGVREMLEGAVKSINGAQKAYSSVSQRADLLEVRLKRLTKKHAEIEKTIQ